MIPPQAWADPRRISRAHEMFDEIVAFTFGHELSHHYLKRGIPDCARLATAGRAFPAVLDSRNGSRHTAVSLLQPAERNLQRTGTQGATNVLDTGRTRAVQAYRWSEEGGLWLRLLRASWR